MNEFLKAMNERDFATLERLIHPDFVGDMPQSRERIRGFASFRAQMENYPGGAPAGQADLDAALLTGGEDRWAISPGYTVLPLAGPDRFTAALRTQYPDGSVWHIVVIIDIADDRVIRSTTYFGPEFEPPEWRKGLTERY
jgi:hypothetical protein